MSFLSMKVHLRKDRLSIVCHHTLAKKWGWVCSPPAPVPCSGVHAMNRKTVVELKKIAKQVLSILGITSVSGNHKDYIFTQVRNCFKDTVLDENQSYITSEIHVFFL